VDLDAFWQLIADSLEHAPGRSARERYLKDRLAALAPVDILAFQTFLDGARNEAFTWDLWGAAMRIFGGRCSDDGFVYFGLWLIGRGRSAFERAVTAPDSLAQDPAIIRLAGRHRSEWNGDEEWPEWESLDYVPANAYGLATDNDDPCREDFRDALATRPDAVSFSAVPLRRNPDGERWDACDELTAAMKIPLLAARFPVVRPS
jgi:Protein of unknown function (DUF4240)